MLLPKMLLGNVDGGSAVNPVRCAPDNDVDVCCFGAGGLKEDCTDQKDLVAQLAGQVVAQDVAEGEYVRLEVYQSVQSDEGSEDTETERDGEADNEYDERHNRKREAVDE